MVVRELLIAVGYKLNRRSVQQTEDAIEKTKVQLMGAETSANSLGKTLRGAFIGLGIAAAIAGVGRAMVGTIVNFQRLQAQLQTIEGDEAKAEKAFARLQKFAATTPFQLENVVTSFARLRAVGLNPTNDDLTALGDVAAGMGKDITEFADAAVAATTGEMERLKQFGIVAKQQGDKVTFLFKGQKKTIKKEAGEIFQYLTDLGKAEFAGGMERQAKTVGGAFSNLQDNIAKFFSSVGESGLGDALVELIQSLTGIAAEGKGAAFILGRTLAGAVKSITSLIRLAKDNSTLLGASIAVLGSGAMLVGIGNAATALGGLSAAMTAAKVASLASSAAIGLSWGLVIAAFVLLGFAIEDVFGYISGESSVIGDTLKEVFGIESAEEFILALKDMQMILFAVLGVFLLMLGGPVAAILALVALAGYLVLYWDEVKQAFINMFTEVANFFVNLIGWMLNSLVLFFNKIADFIGAYGATLWAPVISAFDSMMAHLSTIWDDFMGKLDGAMNMASNFMDDPISFVANAFGEGAASPAVDMGRRANQVANNQSNVNVQAQVPITINPPPGADSSAIANDVAARIEGVVNGAIDSAAADMDGAVDG